MRARRGPAATDYAGGMRKSLLFAVGLLVLSSCGPAFLTADLGAPPAGEVPEVPGEAAALPQGSGASGAADSTRQPDAGPWQQAKAAAREQVAALAADEPQRTQPEPADTPLGLAAQLEVAERVVRDDDAGPQAWAAAGHLQQVAVRRLVSRPDWDDEVRAAIAEPLVGFVDLHLDAGRDLADMHPTPDYAPDEWPPPPPWRIVEPRPMDELLDYYQESAAAVDVHWAYLAAINLVETRMGRIDGVSWAGAQGPMQFMPATWDWVGAGDVTDPRDSIMAAGRLLAANGAPGDMPRALYGYNNDRRYARAVGTYAHAMKIEPRLLRAYYHWQVYIPGPDGRRLLPIGFDNR